ncbi:HesA/MoeB/ThiF family protein [Aquisalimonas asiatica]|uniref:Molybdopterin-synthase adenylyltransferase n=1 Tax=Aquisalimonas asiatica TaxID=406100 RepID=A0A1H8VCX8_9GAMM|nr:molybdopterin-synthase adenylyltransferase MoeB [Aquisalimonas asiatica]SEP13027.1 adenylyltransferase and sulfurtransferase [Aquisalimonas asiatica]
MDDAGLLRYSRQIMLPDVDMAGQEALSRSRVLIVGLGGLGSPAALYLAAAGIGTLVLADDDHVDLTNLQRQILHGTADVDRPKTASARDRLHALNPEPRIELINDRLQGDLLHEAAAAADVVLDGTDNFDTRFAVNAACVATGTPLISGAAIRLEGQLGVFRPDLDDGPCYACLFPPDADTPHETCSETGVLGPVVGVVGSLQATEAIRLITGFGTPATGRFTLWDARSGEWRSFTVARDPACQVCGTRG